jgi:drug/metabolite transporter (DMT)-like permease
MIYLVVSSLIWGFSYGLIKGNLTGLSPDLVACMRMVLPFICFLPLLRLKNLRLKDVFVFLLIGAIQYGAMYLCVVRAYQFLAAYQIVLFAACTPIYVILINDAFSKKFSFFYFLMALLSLVGSSLLYYQSFSWGGAFKGFLLVQVADICFAFGQVAYKRYRIGSMKSKDSSIYALLFLGGSIITALSTSLLGGWGDLGLLSLKQGLILAYLGVVASGLCFFWWSKGSQVVCTGSLAVCNNLKTPLGVAISILFFGEKANYPALTLSFLFIGAALFFSELYSRRNSMNLKKKEVL